MIVVADAGPLHYLILIGQCQLLETFFGGVVVPRSVYQELLHPHASEKVREWLLRAPDWVRVQAAAAIDQTIPLGAGEREAIALAEELRADLLLVDDRKARRIAEERGIPVAGTVGLLRTAHERRLLDLRTAIAALMQEGFRISPALIEGVLSDLGLEPPEPR